jgi:hypothetical protein
MTWCFCERTAGDYISSLWDFAFTVCFCGALRSDIRLATRRTISALHLHSAAASKTLRLRSLLITHSYISNGDSAADRRIRITSAQNPTNCEEEQISHCVSTISKVHLEYNVAVCICISCNFLSKNWRVC